MRRKLWAPYLQLTSISTVEVLYALRNSLVSLCINGGLVSLQTIF